MLLKNKFFLVLLVSVALNTIIYSQTLQWQTLVNSPNNSARFEDVYFLDANTGWIVDFFGKVFKTTDGGNDWDTISVGSSLDFRSIGFFDSQNGILGTLDIDTNRVLYRSTNGGLNWSLYTDLPSPRPFGICGISIVNENVAYACGRWDTPARIIKTNNKGVNWTSVIVDTSMANSLVDCYFWTPDSGIVVGGYQGLNQGKSCILKTTNGGISWQRTYVSTRINEYCWKVSFVNRNIGFASIQRNGLSYYLKSNNNGDTWEDKPFRNYVQQGIGFINENTGWIGGWTGPTYETTDAGNTWHTAGFGMYINRFRFINDTLAYAVGSRVYKYSRQTVGINLTSSEIPSSFRLYQNFPNPFNPVTKIKFELQVTNYVSLKVYDILGNEVATVVNEQLLPGSYEADFNSGNLSSGVYFYKLWVSTPSGKTDSPGETGEFSDVKKMIITK